MNTKNKSQIEVKSIQYKERSYYEWGCNMQILRKGNGEIAMTEGELARFFRITWRKFNNRLQEIIHNPNLQPAFQLDSTEAHFFRKYIIHELQRPSATITPIFLFGSTPH